MTKPIHLPVGKDSYPIHIGAGLLGEASHFAQAIRGRRVFVVSNPTVADLYMDTLTATLADYDVDVFLIEDGEQHKNLGTLAQIMDRLLLDGHNRTSALVALGGGVVGDTAGFAAAIYQRGIDYIQVPTSLLAQVDSSVGGKTGVNHPLGKNMIGAFHQPKTVVIDVNTLKTLPPREVSAGLAEVIKHGMLADSAYFDWVAANIAALRECDAACLTQAIAESCRIKSEIVAEDERETGRRALLNLGHTFAHAIEAGLGYGEWLHGEAVGAGLVMAADLSCRLGRCSREDVESVKQLVTAAGLPTAPPESFTPDKFIELMARDKKAVDAGLRFVLLKKGLGDAELVDDVPADVLRETLSQASG